MYFFLLLINICFVVVTLFYLFSKNKKLKNENIALKIENSNLNTQLHQRRTLKDEFNIIANEMFKDQTTKLMDIASARFNENIISAKKDMELKQNEFEKITKPISDALNKVEQHIHSAEKNRIESFSSLNTQLDNMRIANATLKDETSNLVNALKNPQTKGRWGEFQLRKVVEMAGMLNCVDFIEQSSITSENNELLKPDMIIKLPNNHCIVVDAKTPTNNYLSFISEDNHQNKEFHLQSLASGIRTHIKQLSRKNYFAQFDNTPDFVVLFIPNEAIFSAALSIDPELIEIGVEQKVIIATPITLIALLRSIAYGLKQEKISQNNQQIAELGKELHNRLKKFIEHFEMLGKSIANSVDNYNKAISSFDSRVMVSARKFEDLAGINSETIEDLKKIDKITS